jgi:hypothetical protein
VSAVFGKKQRSELSEERDVFFFLLSFYRGWAV